MGKTSSWQTLSCNDCGRIVEKVGETATGVICSYCTMRKALAMDASIAKEHVPSIGPRGWHLRQVFVDVNLNVYHKGVEQPKLKGSLPATKVKKAKAKTAAERIEAKRLREEKKQAKLLKLAKKREAAKNKKNKK